MKILLVIADLGLGGAQQVVVNLANELVRQGHKVTVYDVYPNLRKPDITNRLSSAVKLISPEFKTKKYNLPERVINSILYRTGINKKYIIEKKEKEHKVSLLKQKIKFDVVNSHVWWADKFVYENISNRHKNWWITLHGSYSNMIKNKDKHPNFIKALPAVLEKSKGVIYLADTELENINNEANYNQKNIKKIYNGIPQVNEESIKNLREELEIKKDDFVIFCASRSISEKGWEELIEAVIELNKKYKNIKLLLAGDGPKLEQWQNKYSEKSFIQFLGFRNDVASLISSCDIVALLSYSEALPTILIESIFLKKPIIATNVGETKHIIKYKVIEAGVLLNKKPSKPQVCSAIEEMLDKSRYQNFSENTDVIKKQFEVERMANEYLKCFNEK